MFRKRALARHMLYCIRHCFCQATKGAELSSTLLPSSTYRGARAMPLHTVHEPYSTSNCTRVQGWAFFSMHGICPSSQFHSGNYAHSLFDILAPMFRTLQVLEDMLGEPSLPHLAFSQVADPSVVGENEPNNCDRIASAILGFGDPRGLFWDDVALAAPFGRLCFDTLVIGANMDMATGGHYQIRSIEADSREAHYRNFVRTIYSQLGGQPAAFSSDSIKAAVEVRTHSRRIINLGEVVAAVSHVWGAPHILDFQAWTMSQVVLQHVVCGMWRVACGVWHVACGLWHMACGVWCVAYGI